MAESTQILTTEAGLDEADDAEDFQQAWRDGIYEGKHERPGYYQESPMILRILKAIILSAAAIGPYYIVLDQIGTVKSDAFVPCSNHSCTYMRLWPAGESLPATGMNFIRVRNGVKRPIAMAIPQMVVYSVDYVEQDSIDEKKLVHTAENPPDDQATRAELKRQQAWIDRNLTKFSMAALVVTKTPLRIVMLPAQAVAQFLTFLGKGSWWGMHHVASATCPHVEDMAEQCKKHVMKRKIINHLAQGTSKYVTVVGIILWFTLTCLHDIMLLSRKFNDKVIYPLFVGAAATVSQGVACAAVFLWAMGATEVFAAPAGKGANASSCMCYYELPPLQALLALSTPFALLFSWVARIQLLALSALYGDYLYNAKFIVPHHLAKKSMLWTWSILMSPKTAGTVKDQGMNWYERIMRVNPKNFDRLYLMMFTMYVLRWLVLIIVSVAAAPFMVRVRELLSVLTDDSEGSVHFLLRFVVQPLPAVLALIMGIWGLISWHANLVDRDHMKLFCDREEETPKPIRWALYLFFSVLILVSSIACLEGLWPSHMIGPDSSDRPSLALAELWGCCGFSLCLLTIVQITHEVFCLEEEMNMLRKVGDQPDAGRLSAVSVLGQLFA